ncbi:MAG: 16S rRNA (guanine(527)-N(7))-methyltransferase RsmG [Oscillospiraceae bacterium]|jgi:16S rRNA (guanine527-N7)-methyltransferase|nr:16S rRNA (guanine(527)-N(7))-methyltransferase RsmG [Oscillospiraceae bacterium]MDE6996898.1 16S rRNA (guanine(527)-N(7))-methyltransferase RsmG [Oscillospiraceae bacterium]
MRDILVQGLDALGLDKSRIPALEQFSAFMLERNQVMNLTAITEPKDIAALHLLDSLALIPAAGLEAEQIVDVGTGAGFPGMPLAIVRPSLRVTLLDSLGKRVDFLKETCKTLKLDNTECVHARAEEFAVARREIFDAAVSRAVAALPVLCELSLPLVRIGGRMLAMKSSHTEEEIRQAESAVRILGGRLEWVKDYTIPTTDVVHRVICIQKVSPTPKKYPRRFALIKKSPLGVPGQK